MKLGAYQLIKQIAQGGIADIYLAKTKNAAGIDRYLVCKCIRNSFTQDSQFLSSIINEAQFCVRLRHPNILEIFDLCYCENSAFLTMEYLDAQDLHKLLNEVRSRGETLPIPIAIYVVSQIALGLHAAHELTTPDGKALNLVHRDISPENILFGSDGSIKLADFGIAKTCLMPDVTPQDEIKGKFNYMSPEQAWGDHVDRRSDIFSLGIVLYEILLGQGPYPYAAVADVIQHARIASFASPSDIQPDFPVDLESIILKALDLDKNDRYQTALEFKIALDNCVAANRWRCTKDDWLKYLSGYIPFPNPPLPRMHAGEISPDESSILKPEYVSASITEDMDATGQASPEMVKELRRLAGYVSSPSSQTIDASPSDGITSSDGVIHEDTVRTASPLAVAENTETSQTSDRSDSHPSQVESPKAIADRRFKNFLRVAFIITLVLFFIFMVLFYLFLSDRLGL